MLSLSFLSFVCVCVLRLCEDFIRFILTRTSTFYFLYILYFIFYLEIFYPCRYRARIFFIRTRFPPVNGGCENKSIFPFISQYITVVFFILIRWYRKSKFISVRESTIPETHLPVLSGMYENVLKYGTRFVHVNTKSSRKPFTSIIRK